MLRASRGGAKVGDTVYLIANQWFYKWKKITGYNVCLFMCVCTCVCVFEHSVVYVCVCICACVHEFVCIVCI